VKVLVTGHEGYIGSVLVPLLRSAGHEVTGLDAFMFDGSLGPPPAEGPAIRDDVRDVEGSHLEGFDAVVHLAALSNDPLGYIDPSTTYEINHLGSARVARLAKTAGVTRFVFASSCSLYGAASSDDILAEDAAFNPVTPYGESKVLAERDLSALADDDFSPTFLRNATVYGFSPRLRLDVVVNDLVANAFATGEVVIRSDGTPWRPLVHIEDASRAALAALEAPREAVHGQAFNIGRSQENYQVRDLGEVVTDVVQGSRVVYAEGGGPDTRSYRVDFSKAADSLPGFRPTWTVRDGVHELLDAYRKHGLAGEDLASSRFIRLRRIQELQGEGRLGPDLRWLEAARTPAGGR